MPITNYFPLLQNVIHYNYITITITITPGLPITGEYSILVGNVHVRLVFKQPRDTDFSISQSYSYVDSFLSLSLSSVDSKCLEQVIIYWQNNWHLLLVKCLQQFAEKKQTISIVT